MKNNILVHFAIKDMIKHRQDTLITLMTLLCIAIICSLATAFTPLFANQRIIEYQQQYGTHDYLSSSLYSQDELDHMTISLNGEDVQLKDADLQYCYEQYIGTVLTDGPIRYITGDSSIIAIELKTGVMPQKADEIAVQESVLESLGYQQELDQVVEIPYRNDEGYQVVRWKIVGILKPTGESAIITAAPDPYQKYQVYIDVKGQDEINNADELGIENSIDHNIYVDMSSLDALIVVVQFVLFIVGCMILSGLTIAAFENRKDDYALLRGIGATKRQLYCIVLLQSLILIMSSLFMAWLIASVIIMIIRQCVDTIVPLTLSASYFSGVIVIIMLMTLISYFMPARGACQKALTGSFDGTEFQYFYYRYKKLHRMRPFYLGWRQLVNHKKQMIVKIFLIFISSLMMMKIIGNHINVFNLQQQKTSLEQPGHQEVSITMTPGAENLTNINPDDFKAFQPFSKEMRYIHMLDYGTYSGYFTRIYCFDKSVKDEFQFQNDLQAGQVIVSSGFIEMNNIDIVVMEGDTYQIAAQLQDDDIFIIMAPDDFQKYGDTSHYQMAKIYFQDIHQKTKGLIAYAKENQQLKYDWVDSLQMEQINLNIEIEETTKQIPIIEISIMLGAGLIYIYQLSYEILKQKETIGTYQLMGLRKFEIWKIYAYKSIMIAVIGLICAIYYHFADILINAGGDGKWMIYLTPLHLCQQLLPALLMIICFILLSLLPIYSILKKDGLENKNMRE